MTSTDSYQIYYENTDLVVKRLKHGKLDDETTRWFQSQSVGIPSYANLLHSEKGVFEDDLPDTTRWFHWDQCPVHGHGGWRFPGQGTAYASCGTFYYLGCLEHNPGYAEKHSYSCRRAECPVCGTIDKKGYYHPKWLGIATNKIVKRIKAGLGRRKAIHVSISSPPDTWDQYNDKKKYSKMRRKVIKRLKMWGIHGGCLIFHPYKGDNKRGWHYQPHFHTLCDGWLEDHKTLGPKLNGWVVRNHRIRKTLGGTAWYQLSHAGIRPGNNAVGWFGSMAYNKLQKIPETPAERPMCPVCGDLLSRVIYLGDGDNPFSDPKVESLDIVRMWWSYVT